MLFLAISGLKTYSPPCFLLKSQSLPLPKWSVKDLYFSLAYIPTFVIPELTIFDNVKSINLYLPAIGIVATGL